MVVTAVVVVVIVVVVVVSSSVLWRVLGVSSSANGLGGGSL